MERRRVRRTFEKIVDPKTVEALLRDDPQSQPLKQGRIEFVLAFVRDDSPSQVSVRMGKVIDAAVAQGAVVHHLVGSLAIIAFGTGPVSTPASGNRTSLVGALRQQLAQDIKVVHGAADGHYGLFGGESHTSYTFLVPRFDAMLATLSRLKFGEAEEFPVSPMNAPDTAYERAR